MSNGSDFDQVQKTTQSHRLTIEEVLLPEAGVNVALGKTAVQSSICSSTHGCHGNIPVDASRAVDGNTASDYHDGSCTHTTEEDNPSWWVDLGQPYAIGRVTIFNRMDCCPERLNPLNIHIGDSAQVSENPRCGGDHRLYVKWPSISVSCQGMKGRYVGVRLPGYRRVLSLCEVQVFSGVNIALGKTAVQSSRNGWSLGNPRSAVDGNTASDYRLRSCTHTAGEANPSWWVDLGQPYAIERVLIFNRMDCCPERLNPFNIHIGDSDQVSDNPRCGGDHQIDVNRPSISVSCQGMKGRYVGVRLPGFRVLTLCEVQVFPGRPSLHLLYAVV
ncbi:PREDICTED: uncharacterized protein LOC109463710 [Branchiostoma belcheri]|uniref:Uncharacterized protein LOC109463710 n=1 Tax=Branchiostoma belcheri TaxID=7741 RepID=A0A6P4XVJ3_BRABE|nr:PREDICTED: uncharacterized protein LOC109463710 [Branchiostoma belcheri]